MKPEPLYLVGPTASGKSSLAARLAEKCDGEIVNVDAFQLYQNLDICTAKPSTEDLKRVPHHLYGVLPLTETCDAARYTQMAQPVIAEILSRGRLPIVVGGSGLYVKALTHGLSDLPSDDVLRKELAEKYSDAERVAKLLELDPAAELTMNLKNDRYVSRALEICLLTGQPQSVLRQQWGEHQPVFQGVCLVWERPALNVRIELRTLKMIDAGLVDEIAAVSELSATSEKAIGIREIRQYLAKEGTLEESVVAIQTATRQYAKRQQNWFRRETGFQRVEVNETSNVEELADQISALF